MNAWTAEELILDKLSSGIPAVSKARAASFAEACIVCLENQGHSNGVSMAVQDQTDHCFYRVRWNIPSDARSTFAWADAQEAVEEAATGVALLLIRERTEFTAIERSSKGTGFDYYLGYQNDTESLFIFNNAVAGLEISGILKENPDNTPSKRFSIKLKQIRLSPGFPSYVIVVEFSRPLALMALGGLE